MNIETKCTLGIFLIILILLVLTGNTGKGPTPLQKPTPILTEHLSKLARQAKHFYFLAKQDQNPLMSLVHLCMAVSKLDSLTNQATTDQIRLQYNIDVMKLSTELKELQQELTQEINQLAPKMALPVQMLL